MLYSTINELDNFQFHDAEIKEITLTDSDMTWSVSAINATTSNSQNVSSKDMCVSLATITFENPRIDSIAFTAYTVHDANNNLIKDVKSVFAKPEEYNSILSESTNCYCFIYGMVILLKVKDVGYLVCFNIDGGSGNFYLTFTFSKAIVQWDEYSGEAWYENPKWKKGK